MNKVLYTTFVAMSKDSYGEICNHFGIDKVEESIRHRQEKCVKRYCILNTVIRYVARYSLGSEMLNC